MFIIHSRSPSPILIPDENGIGNGIEKNINIKKRKPKYN